MTVELLHIRDALFGIRPGNRHDRLNKIANLCKDLYGDEDGSAILNSYLHDQKCSFYFGIDMIEQK